MLTTNVTRLVKLILFKSLKKFAFYVMPVNDLQPFSIQISLKNLNNQCIVCIFSFQSINGYAQWKIDGIKADYPSGTGIN